MAHKDISFDIDTNGAQLKSLQTNQESKNYFDRFTARDAQKVVSQKKAETFEEASEMSRKLNPVQRFGITDLGLDLNQVTNPKLEAHILAGILGLVMKEKGLTNEEAFQRLKGLDDIQTLAIVELGLTRDQVLAPKFGEHTVLGIIALLKSKKAKTTQEALGMIQGLDHFQTHGVVFDNLNQSEVKDLDFGVHTVLKMNMLQEELGLTSKRLLIR